MDDEKSNKRALKSPPSYATLPSSSSMVEDFSKKENVESHMDKKESIADSQIVHGKKDGSCYPAKDKTESSTAETKAGKDDSDKKMISRMPPKIKKMLLKISTMLPKLNQLMLKRKALRPRSKRRPIRNYHLAFQILLLERKQEKRNFELPS